MATTNTSTDGEVEGAVANLIHVDDSGTDPTRTVLALVNRDDLSVTIDEESEDFNPAKDRRTRRYRTSNQVTVEATSAIATDQDALDTVGVIDSNGKLVFDTGNREWGSDYYLEVAYNDDELDYSTDPIASDFDLVHRFADIEVEVGDIDPSAVPPEMNLMFYVEGDVHIAADTL